ncbi:hypothetical protein TVAG_257410 [Trichomonas vaginalis G3]|uniref:Uncharacterized protein n=1 Tax=Trichomonas vaginalis (strain ATCC PRA-98 / G3) TaxID=412133 RepID=A2ELH5_TRIV3|nr:armadillo (ARM) repeat-containing protein family [Trichomonas vaginalis G3]EAY06502.1 hypothetical protein TVAG_257410 [Trichomonas vaginalis G3]KAI5538863.1 armadillo (ARM) repeat-containing protein family [Trichomonas vaginalis G3]|eukprot:XP_001318725.1 hypothetical protein [Trichomonas vaginalis G3]
MIIARIIELETDFINPIINNLYELVTSNEIDNDMKRKSVQCFQNILQSKANIEFTLISQFYALLMDFIMIDDFDINDIVHFIQVINSIYQSQKDQTIFKDDFPKFLECTHKWITKAAEISERDIIIEILKVDIDILNRTIDSDVFPENSFQTLFTLLLQTDNEMIFTETLNAINYSLENFMKMLKEKNQIDTYNKFVNIRFARSSNLLKKFLIPVEEMPNYSFFVDFGNFAFDLLFQVLSIVENTDRIVDDDNLPKNYLSMSILEKFAKLDMSIAEKLISLLILYDHINDESDFLRNLSIIKILSNVKVYKSLIAPVINENVMFLLSCAQSSTIYIRELALISLSQIHLRRSLINLQTLLELVQQQADYHPKFICLAIWTLIHFVCFSDGSGNEKYRLDEEDQQNIMQLYDFIQSSKSNEVKSMGIELLASVCNRMHESYIVNVLENTCNSLKSYMNPNIELYQEEIEEKNYHFSVLKAIVSNWYQIYTSPEYLWNFVNEMALFRDFDANDIILDIVKRKSIKTETNFGEIINKICDLCFSSGDPNLIAQGTSFGACQFSLNPDFSRSLEISQRILNPNINQDCRIEEVPTLLESLQIFVDSFRNVEIIPDDCIDLIFSAINIIYLNFDFRYDDEFSSNLSDITFVRVFEFYEHLISVQSQKMSDFFANTYKIIFKFADKLCQFSNVSKEVLDSYMKLVGEACKHIKDNRQRVFMTRKVIVQPLLFGASMVSNQLQDSYNNVLSSLIKSTK